MKKKGQVSFAVILILGILGFYFLAPQFMNGKNVSFEYSYLEKLCDIHPNCESNTLWAIDENGELLLAESGEFCYCPPNPIPECYDYEGKCKVECLDTEDTITHEVLCPIGTSCCIEILPTTTIPPLDTTKYYCQPGDVGKICTEEYDPVCGHIQQMCDATLECRNNRCYLNDVMMTACGMTPVIPTCDNIDDCMNCLKNGIPLIPCVDEQGKPIYKQITFGNLCKACSKEYVEFYTKGEC